MVYSKLNPGVENGQSLTLQRTYACSNRLSLLDVQALFYLILFTLGLPTVCILLRFVNNVINRSSSSR